MHGCSCFPQNGCNHINYIISERIWIIAAVRTATISHVLPIWSGKVCGFGYNTIVCLLVASGVWVNDTRLSYDVWTTDMSYLFQCKYIHIQNFIWSLNRIVYIWCFYAGKYLCWYDNGFPGLCLFSWMTTLDTRSDHRITILVAQILRFHIYKLMIRYPLPEY